MGGEESEHLTVPVKAGTVAPGDPAEGERCQVTELLEGTMAGKPCPQTISTKIERIAKLAREIRKEALTSLSHHIDIDWMHEAHRRTRKDGAAGVDRQTAKQYAENLDGNLESLLSRAKSGDHYRAPPVRRVYIPKGDGKNRRPIGVPTFEDKVLQKAVVMVLEPVFEQDFLDCSFGFRPGRSAHDALEALRQKAMKMGGGWVLEADIKSFFDSVDRKQLQEILSRRVRDGVLIRLIGKWLKAGVMEEGRVYRPKSGTPQGGVISPLLANIFLHEVLDVWFEDQVKPCLRGRAHLVRYADDFVALFEREEDARRVQDVLPKRFGKYGLRLHPEKTRLVRFQRPKGPPDQKGKGGPRPETFDLLGFTHYWGRSRKGNWVVKKETMQARLSRALRHLNQWCRAHRHLPVKQQHQVLTRKLQGLYNYWAIPGNGRALSALLCWVPRIWWKWLSRRNSRGMSWERMANILRAYRLPVPRMRRLPSAANP